VRALEWLPQTAHLGQSLAIDREMFVAFASAAAPNSLRALKQDVEAFYLLCRQKNYRTFPTTSLQVAEWLRDRAAEWAARASFRRYKASLGKFHRLLGLGNPTKHELIRLAIASHRRQVGAQQKQARPLRFSGASRTLWQITPRGIHVRAILTACDGTPTGLLNRALQSVLYHTGLRASELVAIDVADTIEALDPDARLLRIRRSKGDQDGEGATAYLSPRSVRALTAWLQVAGIKEGIVF
jgi:site-specific recombinase XerD